MRVQLAWTMVTELLVTISGILILKLAASLLWSSQDSASISRSSCSRNNVSPLCHGLGIAAPRYIAIARAGAIEGYTESAFATATLIWRDCFRL